MTAAAATGDSLAALLDRRGRDRRPLREFVDESGLQALVVAASKDPNAKVTTLLVSPASGRAVLAVKAATTEAAARAVEAEARALVELRALDAPALLETIPEVVDIVDFHGRPAVVLSAVPGTPMTTTYFRRHATARRDRVAADFETIGRWLTEFHRASAQDPAQLELDAGVTTRLEARFGDDAKMRDDLELLRGIHARLRQNVVPRTAVHGDLWFGNVLLTHGRATGVVDWEAGAATGEPVRDVVRFALVYALYLDRRTRPGRHVRGHPGLRADAWGAGLEYALGGAGWFPELFRAFVGGSLARLGASPHDWRDAVVAGVAEFAALTDDEGFARAQLELFRRLTRPAGHRA